MGSKRTFKTFSMSTTVREINRVPDLISTMIRLENKKKNNIGNRQDKKSKIQYIKEIIRDGFITSSRVDDEINEKINNNIPLSDEEIEVFMEQAPQKPGWSGRLSNYLNKTESLGFAYRYKNKFGKEEIRVTKLGHYFLSNPLEAIFWSLSNIPVNNPFKRNLNSFTVLGAICVFLNKNSSTKISKEKLAFILSIRDYEDIDNHIGLKSEKYLSYAMVLSPSISKTTIFDYVDEMIRTLVFSNLFSRTHDGIKATDFLISKIEKIIQKSSEALDYFKNHIETKDDMINWIEQQEYNNKDTLIEQKDIKYQIKNIAKKYTVDQIKGFIRDTINNKLESISFYSEISQIKRFVVIEWLVALLLSKKIGNIVKPNLSLDMNGYPIAQAGAGKPDIELLDSKNNIKSIVEVTLINNREQLLNQETTNLVRHLKNVNGDQLFLLAPKIHEDVKMFFDYQSSIQNIVAKGINFNDFIINYPEKNLYEI